MTKRIDLRAPVELGTSRRLKRLETSDFGGYTSVNEGTFRVASDEGLLVEGSERITGRWYLDGTGQVRGLLQIGGLGEDGVTTSGSLLAVGVVQFDGKFSTYGETRFEGEQLFVGPTKVVGDLDVEGETEFRGPLTIKGATSISGAFTSTGNVFLNGTTRINGSSFITGTLNVTGATTIQNALTTSGATRLGGTVDIAGSTTLNGGLTMSGSGSFTAGGVSIVNNRITVSAGGQASEMGSSGMSSSTASFGNLRIPSLPSSSGIPSDGVWLMAAGPNKVVIGIPQNVGGPMGDLEWPFDESQITDEYGPRDSPGGIGSTFHRGIDFGAPEGTPIKAAGSGTVVERGTGVVGGTGFGNFVTIEHSGGKRTLYAHMQSASPYNIGDGVAKGATVGPIGNTGSSTGAHLHLEVHVRQTDGSWLQVNPRDVIKKPWS